MQNRRRGGFGRFTHSAFCILNSAPDSMSQNSEQIEAKLCAYLEGELDEQGRAEIEKHLEQHPAHRKLLSEVGKTRGLLRALPREPAPPDICEAFQGQLERSVLLSDFDNSASGSSMKINRWPQHLAVAAVVVLAAGLGLVVFFGLPSGTPQSHYAVVGGGGGRGGDVAATGKIEDGVVRAPAITEGASTAPAVPGTSTEMAGTRGPDSSSAVVPEGLERIPGGGAAK